MTANRGSNAEKSAAQLAAQLAVRSRLEEVIHRNKVVGKKCFRLTPERRKKLTVRHLRVRLYGSPRLVLAQL